MFPVLGVLSFQLSPQKLCTTILVCVIGIMNVPVLFIKVWKFISWAKLAARKKKISQICLQFSFLSLKVVLNQ